MKKKEQNEDANWQIFSFFSVFSFFLPFIFFFCTFRLSGKKWLPSRSGRAAWGSRLLLAERRPSAGNRGSRSWIEKDVKTEKKQGEKQGEKEEEKRRQRQRRRKKIFLELMMSHDFKY